ncbi:MAG: hypothetical protein WCG01_00300 [bacterium]
MKKIILLFSFIYILSGQVVLAVDCVGDKACYGLDASAPASSPIRGKETDISVLAGTLIGQVLAFVGVIFFALILYGGFKWMTAQGNAKQAEEARDIMVRAALGLIIIFSAYAITAFIGDMAQNPGGIAQ